MAQEKYKYSWSDSADDEIWSGFLFDTEQECIQDAVATLDYKKGESIAIGQCVPFEPVPNVEMMLEQIEQDAYEECGEVSEDWNISSRKGREDAFEELEDGIMKLLEKYLKDIDGEPRFWKIINAHEVTI